MQNRFARIPASVVGFAALYVSLYYVSGAISGNQAFHGFASVFFLPAFVRLLAFLMIGYWSIPALFLAALVSLDFVTGIEQKIIISAFLAVGAPLGIALVRRIVRLDVSLSNLTPDRLLWLSLGSATGNTLAYHAGLTVVGFKTYGVLSYAITFIGDTAGTWAIIYLIKTALTLSGHSRSR